MAKFNKELIKEFCGHVAKGMSDKDSAYLCNISAELMCRYLKSGRDLSEKDIKPTAELDKLKVQLYQEYQNARVLYKEELLNQIKSAGKLEKHWAANAWLLERKFPNEFARQSLIEPEDEEDTEINVHIIGSDENDRERIERIEKEIGKSDS